MTRSLRTYLLKPEILRRYKKLWLSLLSFIGIYNLLGFFLVPWLVKTNAESFTSERMKLQTNIKSVQFNPWALSLTINQLTAVDETGKNLIGFERFYVNFQTSSLFRWAWSFDQVHLRGFYTTFERFDEVNSNFSRVLDNFQASSATDVDEPIVDNAEAVSTPRLFFNDESSP